MAENDNSWHQEDDSWRKTTRHGFRRTSCEAGVAQARQARPQTEEAPGSTQTQGAPGAELQRRIAAHSKKVDELEARRKGRLPDETHKRNIRVV
jgi:hypothetical protein